MRGRDGSLEVGELVLVYRAIVRCFDLRIGKELTGVIRCLAGEQLWVDCAL